MVEPSPIRLPDITWAGTPNRSQRSTQDVRLVVVHDPEGSYEGTTAWVRNPAARVSYHVLLSANGEKAVQFVPWSEKAWSCVRFNSASDNVSIAGFAGNTWTYPALNRLARVIAFRLKKRNLPATFRSAPVSPTSIPRGWTFHSELGAAGGGHHDPGITGAKKLFLKAAVRYHLQRGGFRADWGRT